MVYFTVSEFYLFLGLTKMSKKAFSQIFTPVFMVLKILQLSYQRLKIILTFVNYSKLILKQWLYVYFLKGVSYDTYDLAFMHFAICNWPC